MKKKVLIAVCALGFAAVLWIGGSEAAVSDISNHLIRLHILANSDSAEDQAVKLAVRDRVLEFVRENGDTWDKAYLEENLSEIVSICKESIREQGYDYSVRAVVGRFYFPTKQYENIMLPAGEYDAVRIIIGSGNGKNWWCVMYPPLCFTEETKGKIAEKEMESLRAGMRGESFEMIQTDGEEITIKPAFKLVEWWQEVKHALLEDE